MIPISTAKHQFIDTEDMPAEFRAPLHRYMGGLIVNEELDAHKGRWLVPISFLDAADDDTPDEIVQKLAVGEIDFSQYPFDGIDWNILGVTPYAYAGYLRAVRHLRAQLPDDVILRDRLFFLV